MESRATGYGEPGKIVRHGRHLFQTISARTFPTGRSPLSRIKPTPTPKRGQTNPARHGCRPAQRCISLRARLRAASRTSGSVAPSGVPRHDCHLTKLAYTRVHRGYRGRNVMGGCIQRLLASIRRYRPPVTSRVCRESGDKAPRTRSWRERTRRSIPQTLSGCSPRGRLDAGGGAGARQHRRP